MNKQIKQSVSEEEWDARVELAALYRLVALYGWDDLVFTHISVRVPSEPEHFLLNPYGLLFDEICARIRLFQLCIRTGNDCILNLGLCA